MRRRGLRTRRDDQRSARTLGRVLVAPSGGVRDAVASAQRPVGSGAFPFAARAAGRRQDRAGGERLTREVVVGRVTRLEHAPGVGGRRDHLTAQYDLDPRVRALEARWTRVLPDRLLTGTGRVRAGVSGHVTTVLSAGLGCASDPYDRALRDDHAARSASSGGRRPTRVPSATCQSSSWCTAASGARSTRRCSCVGSRVP